MRAFEAYTKKGQQTEQGQMLLRVLDCTKAELMSKRSVLEDRVTFLLSKVKGLGSMSELDELGALLDSLGSEVEGLLSEEDRVRERRRVVEEQRKQQEKEKKMKWMVERVKSKGYSRRGAEKFVRERALYLKGGLQGVYKIMSKLEKMQ
jgi:hypothetical protein